MHAASLLRLSYYRRRWVRACSRPACTASCPARQTCSPRSRPGAAPGAELRLTCAVTLIFMPTLHKPRRLQRMPSHSGASGTRTKEATPSSCPTSACKTARGHEAQAERAASKKTNRIWSCALQDSRLLNLTPSQWVMCQPLFCQHTPLYMQKSLESIQAASMKLARGSGRLALRRSI